MNPRSAFKLLNYLKAHTFKAIGFKHQHATHYTEAFNAAFRAGSVMGFALCGLAMLVLYGEAVQVDIRLTLG